MHDDSLHKKDTQVKLQEQTKYLVNLTVQRRSVVSKNTVFNSQKQGTIFKTKKHLYLIIM